MPLQDDLYQLYLLDCQVRGMESRLNSALRRKNLMEERLGQYRQQAEELDHEHRLAVVRVTSLEKEAQEAENHIAQLRQQMNAVTNNKEYAALLVEVNTFKDKKSGLEDQTVEAMEAEESIRARQLELAGKIAEQEKLVLGAESEAQERAAEVSADLAVITGRRDEARTKLPAEALAVFDKASRVHDGEALAEIQEENRKNLEYSCGGCFMHLPVQAINAVLMHPETLTSCPSCQRILHVNAELREVYSEKAS